MRRRASHGWTAPGAAPCALPSQGPTVVEKAACGDGPVDAVFHAINAAVGFEVDLKDYQLRSVTAGQDAMGEASVSVRQGSRSFNGRGVSTDVVEASAKAYLNALNKMISECGVPAAKEAG